MPRVNRDLQRRMAARRERERRRPGGDRRYNFGTPETDLDSDESLLEENGTTVDSATVASKPAVVAATRASTRPASKPFSAYSDEYAYVYSDLRRVAAVVGGLLVALIVLYVVLPLLVH